MRRSIVLLTLALLASIGCATSSDTASRSADEIEITMRDSVFDPKTISVKRGEEVTFRFVNRGSLEHEAFIGEAAEQKAHERGMEEGEAAEQKAHERGMEEGEAAEQKAHERGMEEGETSGHHMGDATFVSVKPGRSATLTHTFSERGTTLIGCHVPGHYASGMRIEVKVT